MKGRLIPFVVSVFGLASCASLSQYYVGQYQDGVYYRADNAKPVKLYSEDDFKAMAAANLRSRRADSLAASPETTPDREVSITYSLVLSPWSFGWYDWYWYDWYWHNPWHWHNPWCGPGYYSFYGPGWTWGWDYGWHYGWYDSWYSPWYSPWYGAYGYRPGRYTSRTAAYGSGAARGVGRLSSGRGAGGSSYRGGSAYGGGGLGHRPVTGNGISRTGSTSGSYRTGGVRTGTSGSSAGSGNRVYRSGGSSFSAGSESQSGVSRSSSASRSSSISRSSSASGSSGSYSGGSHGGYSRGGGGGSR